MPRITQAQAIEHDNEQQALRFFEQTLFALPDPRRRQGVRYPLRTVVVIALMAMICGSDDAEAMEVWGTTNGPWLAGFLELPHGTPSQDVFLSVFAALEPAAFGAVLRSWAGLLAARLRAEGIHIAVDGKTSRRSFDTASEQPALHTVSAWLSDVGLVLGENKTSDKSNEITAIPELLRLLDLRNATVTIDAMGCQTAIAKTIVDGGGNYLLAVKGNQPTLHEDIAATFAEAADARVRTLDEQPRPAVAVFEEVDKGHGRVEKRTVQLCSDLSEIAYYIGSDPRANVDAAALTIRRHWSIENELHWVLDIADSTPCSAITDDPLGWGGRVGWISKEARKPGKGSGTKSGTVLGATSARTR